MSSVDISNVAAVPHKEAEEEQPSAIREGLQELGAGFFDLVAFWATFQALWKKPELAVHDPENRLKIAPLTFAAQAAVLLYLVVGTAGWFADTFFDVSNFGKINYTRDIQKLDAEIVAAHTTPEKMAAEKKKQHYELVVKAQTLETSASQAATATSYLIGAWAFARVLQRWREKYPRVLVADRAFLYEVTTRNFLPAYVLIIVMTLQILVLQLLPGSFGGRLRMLVNMAASVVYIVGAIWIIVMNIVTCRNLVAMLGIPTYTLQKGQGDNKVHHAIVGAYVLASVLMVVLPMIASIMVGNLFMWVRHA